MKKNTMMRVASVLMVAVLLSTSVISGTFAKYTTQDSASDSARVAKWGVELQVVGNLYGDHYAANQVAPSAYTTNTAATVSASSKGTDVVAPGTIGDTGMSFKLNGTPEVSGTITTTIAYENIYLMKGNYGVMVKLGKIGEVEYKTIMEKDGAADTDKLYVENNGTYTLATAYNANTEYYTLEDYVELTENYYPVEYQMTGGTTKYNENYSDKDTKVNQLAEIANAIGGKLGDEGTSTTVAGLTTKTYSKSFTPNTDLASTIALEGQNITWKWDFENGTGEASGNNATMYSKADTILGNLQAGASEVTVVKAGAEANTYAAPAAAADGNANDYNLETSFSIDITVTQVD